VRKIRIFYNEAIQKALGSKRVIASGAKQSRLEMAFNDKQTMDRPFVISFYDS
jgi:hypothetical protein